MNTSLLQAPKRPDTHVETMRAYCSARWPSPPMPQTATRSAGLTPATLTAL